MGKRGQRDKGKCDIVACRKTNEKRQVAGSRIHGEGQKNEKKRRESDSTGKRGRGKKRKGIGSRTSRKRAAI